MSGEIGRRCCCGDCCSWRCLYLRDVFVEFLDFIVINVIVKRVGSGHCVGRVVDLSEWGKVSFVTRNVTKNVTRKSGKYSSMTRKQDLEAKSEQCRLVSNVPRRTIQRGFQSDGSVYLSQVHNGHKRLSTSTDCDHSMQGAIDRRGTTIPVGLISFQNQSLRGDQRLGVHDPKPTVECIQ